MAFALYTLCVSSFATVYGHRLALQGPTGSVERAVAVMMKSRTSIFVSFALSMFCLIIAASAMAWVKMRDAAGVITGVRPHTDGHTRAPRAAAGGARRLRPRFEGLPRV